MARTGFVQCGFTVGNQVPTRANPGRGWFSTLLTYSEPFSRGSPGLSFDEWFALTWRVRLLRINASFNGAFNFDYTFRNRATYGDYPDFSLQPYISCDDERDLEYTFFGSSFDFNIHNIDPEGIDGNGLIELYGGHDVPFAPESLPYADGDPAWHPLEFYVGAGATIVFNSPGLSRTPSACTGTFLGKPMLLWDGGVVPAIGSIDITIPDVDNAYWEYRDENGANPIWHHRTGARLIDPIPRGL